MDSTRPWRAAVLFGCKMLATDPLRPASCVFRLPWFVLVCLVHPTDGWLDGDPGNLEVKSRQILCCASQSIPEPFCHEAGCIILLEQASAIREYRFPERVDMLCKCKSVGLWLVRPGFPPHPHQWALSAHEPFDIGNFSVLGPLLTVATAEQEHPTKATVTQAQSSCHHYLALVTHTLKSSHLSIFSCFQNLSNEDMLFFCAYLIPGTTVKRHLVLFTLPVSPLIVTHDQRLYDTVPFVEVFWLFTGLLDFPQSVFP